MTVDIDLPFPEYSQWFSNFECHYLVNSAARFSTKNKARHRIGPLFSLLRLHPSHATV